MKSTEHKTRHSTLKKIYDIRSSQTRFQALEIHNKRILKQKQSLIRRHKWTTMKNEKRIKSQSQQLHTKSLQYKLLYKHFNF